MISYRPFLNSDPPRLVEIWRTQPPERALMQPMSIDLFESLIFAKPYFDRNGLIVAVDNDVPVGFAHASFGPTDDESDVSTQLGVTSLVMVRANYQRRGIAASLVAQSEAYLRRRGAQVLYAGGIRPLNGFYLGLYGGSELPGVLDSTRRAQELFERAGYRAIDRTVVYHRDLAGFRPPMDRQQMQIRRRCQLRIVQDPPPPTWWETCTQGGFDRTRFELVANQGGALLAGATFWGIMPLATSWGVHATGLIELEVAEDQRRQGLATHLLGEAFRHFATLGITLVEVQTMETNSAARQLYAKLGFHQIDAGNVYRK